jgi:hypothetical protein
MFAPKHHRRRDVRAALLGFKGEHFADDAQNVTAPFARGDEQLDLVREEQEGHFVAAAGGGDGQGGGDFHRKLPFGPAEGAKRRGGRDIHRQHHGEFALLAEAFDERAAHAIGDVPVNAAHVIAGHVFAQFLEVHAAPLEPAEVGAHHHVIHQPVGARFHAADRGQNFTEGHGLGKKQDSTARLTAPARR